MKLTKYSHACIVLEKDGDSLVIDPGKWSSDFIVPEHVVGVVVTHEHADHMHEPWLRAIIEANPHAVIYAHAAVAEKISDLPMQTVEKGENIHVGKFALNFVGGTHAIIHASYPTFANLGVVIDNNLYYPGDSFALPGQPIQTLLVPVSAPWMRTAEAMDFVTTIKPTLAIPTHDAILSDPGKELADRLVGMSAQNAGISYRRLAVGETIEL